MNKKVVFCGGGNMAEGILRSVLKNEVFSPGNVTVSELNPNRCVYLKDTYKVNATTDATEAMKAADMIIIAVLPTIVPVVAKSLKGVMNDDAVVLTIAAGVKMETVAEVIGADKKIARVMPNTLNQSGNGYSGVCCNKNCDDDDTAFVDTTIEALGQVMHIKEDMFNQFTCFGNTGPLWLYKMVEAMINAGVYIGLSRDDARKIVLKNMLGVSGVLEATGEHPSVKVDQMTSPGGVTIEALSVLEADGFSTAITDSMSAAYDKVVSFE